MGVPQPMPLAIIFNNELNYYKIMDVAAAVEAVEYDMSNKYRIVLAMTPTEFRAMYRKINGMQTEMFKNAVG